jgi:hypothetical protein
MQRRFAALEAIPLPPKIKTVGKEKMTPLI